MSEALYERYKDALRRGHLATLRGRHDAALAAYVEAATIAPERALPHTSIGTVSLRVGRPADALTAFDHALDRAPNDEGALVGRADALVALGRPSEAAETLDRLSAAQEAAGRTVDALDSARRSLELAESRSRRRAVESLVERLRVSVSDAPGQESLARALHLLERTSVAMPELDQEAAAGAASGDAGTSRAPTQPVGPVEPGLAGDEPPTHERPTPAPEVGSPVTEPRPDPLKLLEEAEATVDSGDAASARAGLLEAAITLDRAGFSNAALDACYEALALAPDDPDLHLALADLYLDRGWRVLAADKLRLLGQLADLTGDDETGRRVREVARVRMADDARVQDLLD